VLGKITSTGGGITLDSLSGRLTASGTVNAAQEITGKAGSGATLSGRMSAGGAISLTAAGGALLLAPGSNTQAAVAVTAQAASATLSGQVTAPRINVFASVISLQGGTLVVGGSVLPPGIAAKGVRDLSTDGAGAFFKAETSFTQAGRTEVKPLDGNTGSTVRITLSTPSGGRGTTLSLADLNAPTTSLVLDLNSGSGTGTRVTIGSLTALYTGIGFGGFGTPAGSSGLNLTDSTVGGQAGQAAAAGSRIAPVPNQDYRVNGCAIASVNCIVLRAQLLPVGNPLKEIALGFLREQDDDRDLLVPNISDQGL